ncbi:helix-turn-helix domain-containing protein [Echinicola rosea]|uniref:HTH araC/xylS-type domain-containing protein n=1 Tax=Echinicola rosea TaxID=1807691 RepID=A0ABQ1V080_9BACT|nr:helix-turn-helix domain-containing protein [Echinicola rosea]GGF29722.1 hypothetical protein GCM10011339_17410 [Echinicola rosea]
MMKRYKQFDDVIVQVFEAVKWEHPIHNHNHYEIIFIKHGKGSHHLNGRTLTYEMGDVFMLGPSDKHEFIIEEKTKFVYFKFTKRYINHPPAINVPETWNQLTNHVLKHPERKRASLLTNAADKNKISLLFELIVSEEAENDDPSLIYQLLVSIMIILDRNLKSLTTESAPIDRPIAEEILEYIDHHIREPSKLTLQHLADRFYFSPNYIGPWFKHNMGISLKDYVSQYRLKLILKLLHKGQLSYKQLTVEFGFVDESHLYKFIKNKTGKRLSDWKS